MWKGFRQARQQIMVFGCDDYTVLELMNRVHQDQTNVSEADWEIVADTAFTTETMSITKSDDAYTITTATPVLPEILGRFWERRYEYDIALNGDMNGNGPLPFAVLAFVVRAEETAEAINQSVRSVTVALNSGRLTKLRRLVIIIENALNLLDAHPSPIDDLDAWRTIQSGQHTKLSPLMLARSAAYWPDVLMDLDRKWSMNMRVLARAAAEKRVEVITLPVSITGVDARTGELLDKKRPSAIGFNLRPIGQALCPDIAVKCKPLFE